MRSLALVAMAEVIGQYDTTCGRKEDLVQSPDSGVSRTTCIALWYFGYSLTGSPLEEADSHAFFFVCFWLSSPRSDDIYTQAKKRRIRETQALPNVVKEYDNHHAC